MSVKIFIYLFCKFEPFRIEKQKKKKVQDRGPLVRKLYSIFINSVWKIIIYLFVKGLYKSDIITEAIY